MFAVTMTFSRSLIVLLLACASSLAAPRDDLLRAVPSDFTFCVVVQNLRDQASPGDPSLIPRLTDSAVFKQLQNLPEIQKVQAVVDAILKELGVTPAQLRDDILGDALVIAYRKGPAGHPEKEDGLILLHARDDKLLARLIDRINELQIKSGELQAVEPVEGKGGRYFRRVKAVENAIADYYAVRGNRLVFTGSESLLSTTLAALAVEDQPEPPLVARMKQLGVENIPIVCLINPRSFDADLAESAKGGKGSEQSFLKEFGKYWKAVDGLSLSLNLKPSIEIGLAVNVRKTDLPDAAAKFFTEAGKRSPLWDRVPEDAMIAVVGRIHPESLAATFGPFLADEDRSRVVEAITDATRPFLETDDLSPLLRGLGPDIGFWVMPPYPAEKTWCPRGIFAVKIADNAEGKQAEEAAIKGLDFLARLASLSDKGLRVRSEKQGAVNVQYLTHTGAFPPDFRPAFASKSGYVLVADSPQTIANFEAPKTEPRDADEVPIVRVSVSSLRTYLKTHREPLAEFLSKTKNLEAQIINDRLDTLLPLLEGLDRIELLQRTGPNRATIVLRIQEGRK
jgi:hypothetical protein